MKNKILITFVTLVFSVLLIGGCGRIDQSVSVLAPPMAHADDVRFENCLVCHVSDQLAAKPLPHAGMGFTNADCVKAGCHKLQGAATVTLSPSTTQPPSSTTTPPTTVPPTTPAGSTAPTGSATPPPTSSTTSPPPTSATTSAGKVLDIPPKAAAKSAHPDSMKTLCLMCHAGAGAVIAYPLPPTWAGSTVTPGTWTVTAGSPADHTGRTDAAGCLQSGCHVIG